MKQTLIQWLKNSAVYHHACASNYKERELHALKLRISKQQIQNNETQPSSHSMRSSSGISSLQIGNLQCCICGGEDSNSNLHAAGAFHAKKTKTDSLHALSLTQKWKDMALAVDNQFLINKIAFGDVASNELYYHASCLKSLSYQYNQIKKTTSDNSDSWTKAIAFNKVATYLYKTNENSPGTIFKVKDLEKMYIDELALHDISVTTHVTRFIGAYNSN